ncbi:MAG: dockerin type I domain-containing protein [Bacillota bacterium]
MKKVLVFLIVFSMLCSLNANYIFSAENTSAKYGDLNGDDNVNSTDCTLMKRFLLRIVSEFPVSNGMILADVNADQTVDSSDFTLLKRFVLRIITEFPADKIPLATPTPLDNRIYEAEQARFTDAVVDTKHSGYSGTGYVDFDWALGGYIEWNINVAKTGAYNLTFRYANASSNGNSTTKQKMLLL